MNKLLNIIIVVLLFACFYYGLLIYQGLQDRARFQEEDRQKRITRMKFHGAPYAFEERGKHYFVRKPKDIENRKKWIRL